VCSINVNKGVALTPQVLSKIGQTEH